MEEMAVVLLSGGLDSATVLAHASAGGFRCHALSFDYGQRHRAELHAARRVAEAMSVESHRTFHMDLAMFGGSALTDPAIAVPESPGTGGIPVTYVPARNTIMLSVALAWAEVLQSRHIFIGVNAVDYSGYPDCRPAYIAAFQQMANLATRAGVENQGRFTVHAPLILLSKEQIIERGRALGVDYGLTHTCYDPAPGGLACGRCDACSIRLAAFARLGLRDPAAYADSA